MLVGKKELRGAVNRRAVEADMMMRGAVSQAIFGELERLPEFAAAQRVAVYWSMDNEVQTHQFIERWSDSKQILLPVMTGDSLVLSPFEGRNNLAVAEFGVMEPQSKTVVDPLSVELFIVPGVAFDPQGSRLGHGRGFYDRLLAGSVAPKVGICFDYQIFDFIPIEPFDVAVDRVISGGEYGLTIYIPSKI